MFHFFLLFWSLLFETNYCHGNEHYEKLGSRRRCLLYTQCEKLKSFGVWGAKLYKEQQQKHYSEWNVISTLFFLRQSKLRGIVWNSSVELSKGSTNKFKDDIENGTNNTNDHMSHIAFIRVKWSGVKTFIVIKVNQLSHCLPWEIEKTKQKNAHTVYGDLWIWSN